MNGRMGGWLGVDGLMVGSGWSGGWEWMGGWVDEWQLDGWMPSQYVVA